MEAEPIVYIVDDDPAVLEAIRCLVESIHLKAETYLSADAFLKAYQRSGPGCLILDVRMPGISGLELQRRLAEIDAALPVIFVTGHADVRMAVEIMKQGAIELLQKPFRSQELCDTIQKAIRQDVENWRRRERQQDALRRVAQLTPAERAVMDLVAVGKTNQMMAHELGLSVRAIEDRRARMMKKLRVASRAELLELAAAVRPPQDTLRRAAS